MSTDPRLGRADDDAFIAAVTAQLDGAADRVPGATGELVDELRSAAAWGGPPPARRAAVLAAVRAEAGADHRLAAVRPLAPARRRTRPARLAATLLAAAAVAVVFTVGVLAVERALQPDGTTFLAAGSPLAPDASAEITVTGTGSGFSLVLDADGLPAAAPGSYYAAWLRGPKGVVPLGSFHERKTGWSVELWSGVDPAEYPTFEVTLQAEGAPPVPSERVVLRAPVG